MIGDSPAVSLAFEVARLTGLLKTQTAHIERVVATLDNEQHDRVLRLTRGELIEALDETKAEFGIEASL
jgi:hypothetical protein